MMHNLINLIPTGFLLTIMGTLFYSLHQLPDKIWKKLRTKIIYQVRIYQNDELFPVFDAWMYLRYRQHFSDVEASIGMTDYPQAPGPTTYRQPKVLSYRHDENNFIITYRGKKLWVEKKREKIEKAQSIRDRYLSQYQIRGFQAKHLIESLLQEVVDELNATQIDRSIRVYTNNTYGEWSNMNELLGKDMDHVIIDPAMKQELIADLQEFVASRPWYIERGISYKRAYCFYGAPGNGKTSLAIAMADYLHRDIYILNLNCLENDSSLSRCFGNLPKNSLLLIEDIDRAFNMRDNVNSKVTFASLLNSMDGVLSREGLLTVITTNYIDKLDPALLRDGRTDFKRNLPNPTPGLIRSYLELFYTTKLDSNLPPLNVPMSRVQEVCIQNKTSLTAALDVLLAHYHDISLTNVKHNYGPVLLSREG